MSQKAKRETTIKKFDMLFVTLMIVIIVVSFFKAHYGAGGNDESFYITIPYRMTKGDALFQNEWHISMFSAFITFPIIKLYSLFFHSTEKIILHVRYIYIVFNLLVTSVFYIKMRRYRFYTIIAAGLYFLFVPYNIMALCYNNIGIACILLSTVFVATNYAGKKTDYTIAGILYALAVLCQPLLIISFVCGWLLLLLLYYKYHRDTVIIFGLYFTAGCVLTAIPVICYLLINIDFNNFFTIIREITNDPEHSLSVSKRIILAVDSYFTKTIYIPGIGEIDRTFFYIYYCALMVLMSVAVILKKRKKGLFLAVPVFALSILFTLICGFRTDESYFNFLLAPWIWSGFVFYLNTEDRTLKKQWQIAFAFSAAHVTSFLGSNQYAWVFDLALTPVALVSIILVFNGLYSYREKRSNIYIALSIGAVISVLCTAGVLFYTRVNLCFWDSVLSDLNVKIENGVYKGIYTSERNVEKEIYSMDIVNQGMDVKDNVLILSTRTWLSLELKGKTSQFSAWLPGISADTIDKLKVYYEVNPDCTPEYVYICKDEAERHNYNVPFWANRNHYLITETDYSFVVYLK